MKTYLKNTNVVSLRMSFYDKIVNVFDEELKSRVNDIISEYAEIISKKHCIPLDLLLRDVPEIYTGPTCKGTKSNGQRCTFKGVHDGYCGKHVSQGDRIRQRILPSNNLHTHGPEQTFVADCPGCNRSNGLIDLNYMLCNE